MAMKFTLLLAVVGAVLTLGAEEFRDIKARVIPVPQKIEVVSDQTIPLKNDTAFRVISPLAEAEVKRLTADFVKRYWHIAPQIICAAGGEKIADEGYTLDTTTPEVVITASTLAGIRYALRTMRQLAEPERGVARARSFVIPQVKIDDFPQLKFRGFHYYRGTDPVWKIERALRLAAYFKYNYFVLESPIELKKHPEYTPSGALSQKEVRKLIKLGNDLGITVIPQIQIFGHQSSISGGGQILLDKHPEYASLLEPSGSAWCVSNPATVKYIEEIIAEYLDVYCEPPFFHVGCDEAYNAGSCSLCRQGVEYWKKVANFLTHFRDFLAARHARMMIWHDMLVLRDDPAWKGSTANGDQDAEKLRNALPRDILICYWEYRFADHHFRAPNDGVPGFPIFDVFRKAGFDVINSGWMFDTTPALGEKAFTDGGFGILQTTWGQLTNSHNYHTMFAQGSTSGWNPAARYPQLIDGHIFTVDLLNRYVRDINYDMGLTDSGQTTTR